jgi:hypothetical protein
MKGLKYLVSRHEDFKEGYIISKFQEAVYNGLGPAAYNEILGQVPSFGDSSDGQCVVFTKRAFVPHEISALFRFGFTIFQ